MQDLKNGTCLERITGIRRDLVNDESARKARMDKAANKEGVGLQMR